MKKIAVGDLGEFWYGDYKEPFEQLEGGYPDHPKGALLKEPGTLKVLCAYCGKTFDNLGKHVSKHGMTAREYKDEVGLLQSSALVSERVRLRLSADALRRRAAGHFGVERDLERLRAPRPHLRGLPDGRRKSEALNRTGRCYAQVLAKARSIQQKRGKITARLLIQDGLPPAAWRPYFDSVEDLARAISGVSAKSPTRWTDDQLLAALRGLAATLGRTPSRSDAHRYGMPSAKAYLTRYGSWTAAAQAAGLDPNLPSPGRPSPYGEDDHVRMLVAYAMSADAEKAAAACDVSATTLMRVLHKYGFPFPPFRATAELRDQKRQWAAEMARRITDVSETSIAA
jgi:hypothetical protein